MKKKKHKQATPSYIHLVSDIFSKENFFFFSGESTNAVPRKVFLRYFWLC